MKKIAISIAILLSLSPVVLAVGPPPPAVLSVCDVEAYSGTTFLVPVCIENIGSMVGWVGHMSFTGPVELTGNVYFTEFIPNALHGFRYDGDTFHLAQLTSPGNSVGGDGVLAYVEFLATGEGVATITFDESKVVTENGWQEHETEGGTVTILFRIFLPLVMR
jgi:hypothetical protein